MQEKTENKIKKLLIENNEDFSQKLSELNTQIKIRRQQMANIIKEIVEDRENFVKENVPSWYKDPCFVIVHYKEKEKTYVQREGYMIDSNANWIQRETDVLFLSGFEIDEECGLLIPILNQTDWRNGKYVPNKKECNMFTSKDDYIIEYFEII